MLSPFSRVSSRKNPEGRLFTGLLFRDEASYLRAVALLTGAFGPVLFESPPHPWAHSQYYEQELGTPITRRFLFFERMIPQDGLREIKLRAMQIEQELSSVDDKRTVNIDPGYVTTAKVVLASTKDYAHRIYIGGGIFAEVTLYYMRNAYHGGDFAYQDYLAPEVTAMFSEVREGLRRKAADVTGQKA